MVEDVVVGKDVRSEIFSQNIVLYPCRIEAV